MGIFCNHESVVGIFTFEKPAIARVWKYSCPGSILQHLGSDNSSVNDEGLAGDIV